MVKRERKTQAKVIGKKFFILGSTDKGVVELIDFTDDYDTAINQVLNLHPSYYKAYHTVDVVEVITTFKRVEHLFDKVCKDDRNN